MISSGSRPGTATAGAGSPARVGEWLGLARVEVGQIGQREVGMGVRRYAVGHPELDVEVEPSGIHAGDRDGFR
jgi:hypothetical protein